MAPEAATPWRAWPGRPRSSNTACKPGDTTSKAGVADAAREAPGGVADEVEAVEVDAFEVDAFGVVEAADAVDAVDAVDAADVAATDTAPASMNRTR
ncbi:hypothetical protein D3C71_1619800 [compost metagenome]